MRFLLLLFMAIFTFGTLIACSTGSEKTDTNDINESDIADDINANNDDDANDLWEDEDDDLLADEEDEDDGYDDDRYFLLYGYDMKSVLPINIIRRLAALSYEQDDGFFVDFELDDDMYEGTFEYKDGGNEGKYNIVMGTGLSFTAYDEDLNEISFFTDQFEKEQEIDDAFMRMFTPFTLYDEMYRTDVSNSRLDITTHTVEETTIDEHDALLHVVEGDYYTDDDYSESEPFMMKVLTFEDIEFLLEIDTVNRETGEKVYHKFDLSNVKVHPRED